MSQSKGVGGLPPLFVEPTAANDPFEAARVDDITALRKHMESGSHSVDSVDGDGRNSLHWAATKGNLSIVRFLLSENADPNKCDEDNWTPLLSACSSGQVEVVSLLLDQPNINVNHSNNMKCTALHYGCSKQHPQIVELLIERDADVNYRNKLNATPLHRAIANGNLNIIQRLMDAGASVNAQDRAGNTPLHLAAMEEKAKVIEFLLQNNANVSATNKDKETPADLSPLVSQIQNNKGK